MSVLLLRLLSFRLITSAAAPSRPATRHLASTSTRASHALCPSGVDASVPFCSFLPSLLPDSLLPSLPPSSARISRSSASQASERPSVIRAAPGLSPPSSMRRQSDKGSLCFAPASRPPAPTRAADRPSRGRGTRLPQQHAFRIRISLMSLQRKR